MSTKLATMGIDIGTSGIKIVLINDQGRLLIDYSQEYEINIPKPGWAEQDPEIWYEACLNGLKQISKIAIIKNIEIIAIGLTGQMHSLICIDADLEVLRPAILWADQRSSQIVNNLNEQYSKEWWAKWIGNPIASGFTLPSWLWIQANEPGIAEKTKYLLQPKDWLRLRLTGILATDASDASATGFFDPHIRQWSPEILDLAGLSNDNFPEVLPSGQISGRLKSSVGDLCGLSPTIPIIVGGSDQAMQAFSHGIVHEGHVSVTIGSGGQVFSPINKPNHDPELRVHLFCHVVPETWHLEAATLSAGLSLNWLRKIYGNSYSYREMADQAKNVSAGLDGLYFLPYLNGERTPWMDATIRGAFFGLGIHHQQFHLTKAVMEGVVFSLRQGLDIIRSMGIRPNKIIASGGATRHSLWCRLMANIFNLEIIVPEQPEATARGAALTALMSVRGLSFQDTLMLTSARIESQIIYSPDNECSDYQDTYQNYKNLYPLLRSIEENIL